MIFIDYQHLTVTYDNVMEHQNISRQPGNTTDMNDRHIAIIHGVILSATGWVMSYFVLFVTMGISMVAGHTVSNPHLIAVVVCSFLVFGNALSALYAVWGYQRLFMQWPLVYALSLMASPVLLSMYILTSGEETGLLLWLTFFAGYSISIFKGIQLYVNMKSPKRGINQ